MTTVFYDTTALWADCKVVRSDHRSWGKLDSKLSVNRDKTLAYGFTGMIPTQTDAFDRELVTAMTAAMLSGEQTIALARTCSEVYTALVMTKSSAAVVYATDRGLAVSRVFSPAGIGSGAQFLEGRYWALTDTKAAYTGLSTLDHLSSDSCECVEQSALRPLRGFSKLTAADKRRILALILTDTPE